MDSVVVIKLISALLYPVGLVVIFFIVGFLGRLMFRQGGLRALANFCYLISFLSLLIFSNPSVAKWLVESLEKQHPQQLLSEIVAHDVIIVLGGGLRIPLPPAQYPQLSNASDRYWYAVRLFRAGKATKIILAGGNVFEQEGYSGEAYYAAQLMQEWGIPKSVILLEDQSRTTEQNRDNVAQIVQQNGFKSALLVTSAIHMPRAVELFNSLQIQVTPASADILIQQYDSPKLLAWMPSARALMLSTVAMHEYYGKWFAELKALISNA